MSSHMILPVNGESSVSSTTMLSSGGLTLVVMRATSALPRALFRALFPRPRASHRGRDPPSRRSHARTSLVAGLNTPPRTLASARASRGGERTILLIERLAIGGVASGGDPVAHGMSGDGHQRGEGLRLREAFGKAADPSRLRDPGRGPPRRIRPGAGKRSGSTWPSSPCCGSTGARAWASLHGDLQITHVFVEADEVTGTIDWSEGAPGGRDVRARDPHPRPRGAPGGPGGPAHGLRHRRGPRRHPRLVVGAEPHRGALAARARSRPGRSGCESDVLRAQMRESS